VRRAKRRATSERKEAHHVKSRRHMQLPGGAKGTVRSPPKPGKSEFAGRNASEPTCSPVTQVGEAEPLQNGRRQHPPRSTTTRAAAGSLGVSGMARRQGDTLNTGDLVVSGQRPQRVVQGDSQGHFGATRSRMGS